MKEGGSNFVEKRKNAKEGWKNLYGKERERYYNRNGWGLVAIGGITKEERNLGKELRARDRDIQRQEKESRIEKARYNQRYKEIREAEKILQYLKHTRLRKGDQGQGVNTLIKIR